MNFLDNILCFSLGKGMHLAELGAHHALLLAPRVQLPLVPRGHLAPGALTTLVKEKKKKGNPKT